MSSTTWPENVLIRYLTVGGATVDVIDNSHLGRVDVSCTGCLWNDWHGTNGMVHDTPEQTAARVTEALPHARKAAQAHAETCRAIPRPAN